MTWSQRRPSSRGAEVKERIQKEGKSELIVGRCGINQGKGVKKRQKGQARSQRCVPGTAKRVAALKQELEGSGKTG